MVFKINYLKLGEKFTSKMLSNKILKCGIFENQQKPNQFLFNFQEAEKFFAYEPFTAVIKLGCRGAIWISERV